MNNHSKLKSITNTAHNQGRNHKHLKVQKSTEDQVRQNIEFVWGTICFITSCCCFGLLGFHSYERKISQLQGSSGSETKGKILFTPAAAELSANTTGSFTEVPLHASLHGITLSRPCHMSYIHTSQRSKQLQSQLLPAPASACTKAELDTPRQFQGSSSDSAHVINGEYRNIRKTRA